MTRCVLPGSKEAPSPRADSFPGLEMRARGAHREHGTKLKHGTKLGRTLCYAQKKSRWQHDLVCAAVAGV